jgi:nitrogen regulatory protein PII-like uncharacterized protein
MADLFKEVVPSILQTKQNALVSEQDENDYVPFIVNKALSFHADCLHYANEMNMNHHLDKKLQYDFLFHTVRGYKRPFQKWMKREKEEDIELIKEYFNFSTEKAKTAIRILSDNQIKEIKKKLDKGGKNTK